EIGLGYRHSNFMGTDLIITSALFKLSHRDPDVIKSKMDGLMQRRRDKQPLNFPSAGSTFKRPEGYFAGKLIQDAGLMGYTVGGAMVSDKHAGFVVNRGGATAADVRALIAHVQETVRQQFGVVLEPEVRIL
ncbi:MAG: UDP-N-acetylenolpyruvoylglucosamine reductase, partial [Clostridia bacterium]|nr:UDP-N-acetylenolpyruvoylglucosamine reductase [Clostridia bacterium]